VDEDEDAEVTITVTIRELTTLHAALLHWLDSVPQRELDGITIQEIPFNLELYFLLEPPLSHEEIHDLGKRLLAARR
jgi:hypothetical protein